MAKSAYILTALIEKPKRFVYLNSGMHHQADANLDDILWRKRRRRPSVTCNPKPAERRMAR
jgi:hypothetical protein